MTDDILKHLVELKHEYECAASAGLSGTPLRLTKALRVAVEFIQKVESWPPEGKILASPWVLEISAILGVKEVEK